MKLQNKVALVTGAGRGIGREIALKLASEGADLVINDLDAEPLAETAALVTESGRRVVQLAGSVSDLDFGERFVAAALDEFGRLDIIINNAGFTWDNVIQKMTEEQWQTIMDVHLSAPYRILKAAADYIRHAAKTEEEQGEPVQRKVVNISSTSGVFGNAGQANYSAAKAGIIGLTKAMAKEWGRYRVNVNSVAFGLIETRLTQALDSEQASIDVAGKSIAVGVQRSSLDAMQVLIPMQRAGKPSEAAGAVVMLCYPEADYVTGQNVLCSGGMF